MTSRRAVGVPWWGQRIYDDVGRNLGAYLWFAAWIAVFVAGGVALGVIGNR